MSALAPLSWVGIARLGLVQAAIGAVVVMATTTLNRVMAVELALPAAVPGALVAGHYLVQLLRPRWGHGGDGAGRRTPTILLGMAALALGGFGAACGVALMPGRPVAGLALAAACYGLVGLGVGAAGTNLLALAGARVAPERRAAAAAAIWITMIVGFAVTAGAAGAALEPFTMGRLVAVVGAVCAAALALSAVALLRLEGAPPPARRDAAPAPFRSALAEVWAEPDARRFTLFVFVSMLAYGAQDVLLDPFAGRVLGFTPGASTRLSGIQHGGALAGMLAVAALGGLLGRRVPGLLRACAAAGCGLAAAMLLAIAASAALGASVPLRPTVAALGFGDGAFAVAAVGAMMSLAGRGRPGRAGVRMGLWGAAQALAFGAASVLGPALVEAGRATSLGSGPAYAAVFAAQAILFILSARLAAAAPDGAPAKGASLTTAPA